MDKRVAGLDSAASGATSGKFPISDYLQMLKLVFALLSQGGNGTRNEHGQGIDAVDARGSYR